MTNMCSFIKSLSSNSILHHQTCCRGISKVATIPSAGHTQKKRKKKTTSAPPTCA